MLAKFKKELKIKEAQNQIQNQKETENETGSLNHIWSFNFKYV